MTERRRASASRARSHFFAYLLRMKFIRRWGLMHSAYPENIQEHSLRVAQIAHALAVIRNRLYNGRVDPHRALALAVYHDVSEVLTGDMPTPVKNYDARLRARYKEAEVAAKARLLEMVPEQLRSEYETLFRQDDSEPESQLVRAADKICAYIKCVEERSAGNKQFANAEKTIKASIESFGLPEVRYFIEVFIPSVGLTLDELSENVPTRETD